MPIKVLVVNDSSLMREILSDILNSDPEIVVIDTAQDGEEAIRKVFSLSPDVVTLDIDMPEVDGLSALAYIMSKKPTPVVMLSAFT